MPWNKKTYLYGVLAKVQRYNRLHGPWTRLPGERIIFSPWDFIDAKYIFTRAKVENMDLWKDPTIR